MQFAAHKDYDARLGKVLVHGNRCILTKTPYYDLPSTRGATTSVSSASPHRPHIENLDFTLEHGEAFASSIRHHAVTSPTTPRRCVIVHLAISSAPEGLLDNFDDIFLVLELTNAMVGPEMLYECFDVPADGIDRTASRAYHASVLSVRAVSMALYDETV